MEIPKRQAEIDALTRKYLTDPEPEPNGHRQPYAGNTVAPELSDEAVIGLCRKAKNAAKFSSLYDTGDTSAYDGDDSRADQALACILAFYTRDELQLERLFDGSALGQRSKWKNRSEYRRRTIKKALDGLRETYTQPRSRKSQGKAQGEPEPSPNGSPTTPEFRLTDTGNAERLVDRHGEDVRYVHARGRWLDWDGKRWRIDDTGEIDRRAKDTVRSIYGEAEQATDSSTRRELASHAMKCESESRLRAMIALARSEEGIPVRVDALDADPWLLNVANGTIDLRTGKIREHRRDDLITKLAPVEYDPDAECPRFKKFLKETLVDDALISFIKRYAGYTLTGITRERLFAILYGFGKNGKTTLVELLQDVMGDYATNTDTETLLMKRHQGVSNDVAALKGARFVSAAEVEKGRRLAESKVKQLTGTDTVTARHLFGEPFDFRPAFKLWLSTNNKPEIAGTDDAIWDRIRLIPFEQRFEGKEADPKLPEKLREELPGVLAWMVEGALEWQRGGLGEPESVKAATAEYRAEMDTLATFIHERCVVRPDVWCVFAVLYEDYEAWCEESGENPETKRKFGARLKERGFLPDNGTDNVAIRRGIALRDDRKPDGSEPPGDKASDPSRINEETPDEALAGASGGTSSQGINEPASKVNLQITCKSQESGEGINEDYHKSRTFPRPPPREGRLWKYVN